MRRATAGLPAVLLLGCLGLACRSGSASATSPAPSPSRGDPAAAMSPIAESYVKLVLELGRHDSDYVDAYYGPAEWKPTPDAPKKPIPDIRAEAEALLQRLSAFGEPRGHRRLPSCVFHARANFRCRLHSSDCGFSTS